MVSNPTVKISSLSLAAQKRQQARQKRKKYAKKACASCKKAHTCCGDVRPCPRCVRLGKVCEDEDPVTGDIVAVPPPPTLEDDESELVQTQQLLTATHNKSKKQKKHSSSSLLIPSAQTVNLTDEDSSFTNDGATSSRSAPLVIDKEAIEDITPKTHTVSASLHQMEHLDPQLQVHYHMHMIQLHQQQLQRLLLKSHEATPQQKLFAGNGSNNMNRHSDRISSHNNNGHHPDHHQARQQSNSSHHMHHFHNLLNNSNMGNHFAPVFSSLNSSNNNNNNNRHQEQQNSHQQQQQHLNAQEQQQRQLFAHKSTPQHQNMGMNQTHTPFPPNGPQQPEQQKEENNVLQNTSGDQPPLAIFANVSNITIPQQQQVDFIPPHRLSPPRVAHDADNAQNGGHTAGMPDHLNPLLFQDAFFNDW
mmetsp:Transcript_7677/g.28783  ORF Transcript_7677/g.28783 Transcript_7677/m.28783 type:complete len:417 (-) Transcript_7677:128-1378(-)